MPHIAVQAGKRKQILIATIIYVSRKDNEHAFMHSQWLSANRYLKCIAASDCFNLPVPFATFAVPYFGLISWQPSHHTPLATSSGWGMGEASAMARSSSTSFSTSAMSPSFCLGVIHLFSTNYLPKL